VIFEKVTECFLDGTVDKEEYEKKIIEYKTKLNKYITDKGLLLQGAHEKKSASKRLREFRKVLETQDPLDAFDRVVFENIVEKIIVGGYDSTGKPAPFKLTFVLRNQQSITENYDRERYKEKQKEMRRG
jgi:hypothetical protein